MAREIPFVAAGHPCACRENPLREKTNGGVTGPSLRVQGEPTVARQPAAAGRAIPARAGRTPPSEYGYSGTAGHPCACRENNIRGCRRVVYLGPSLRVQGEPNVDPASRPPLRAIPARAGRTR